jgi:DNA-directed RNA polymerase subunit M/transcription elongation factor TFIIS
MHFCTQCGNMYFITLSKDDEKNLSYYCRKCNYTDNTLINNTENLCISKTFIASTNDTDYKHIINQYTKLDPTLPRISHINCPNENCSSNDEDNDDENKKEILYIRYDDTNMKYIYLCAKCDKIWTIKKD